MKPTLVTEGIYQLSVNVENILFEGMWEIPNGVSVNSYIVKGEKTAIIDGVCGWDGVPETLFKMLDEMEIGLEDIDYVVLNHMEPDHSGWLEAFKKIKPDFKVVCTKFAVNQFNTYYGHVETMIVVKEGDTLDLGGGRILEFHEIPNVHWPETMMTFERMSQTLFPCDLFGTFGKTGLLRFDDERKDEDKAYFEAEAFRYFSNVLSTFAVQVKKAVEKCTLLPVRIIAPGHGLVWRENPQEIMDLYRHLISCSSAYGREAVTILWGSMYGMTEKAVMAIRDVLEAKGIRVNMCRLPETSWGQVLTDVLASSGVIIGAPTYEYKMFPPVAAALEEIGRKRIKKRIAMHVGSFGWTTGANKEIMEIMNRHSMAWDFVDPVEFKGMPSEEELEKIKQLLNVFIERIKAVRE